MEAQHKMARIKLRRDTAANWTSANPVLDLGEPGYETNTQKLKIGNGVDDWVNLAYFTGGFNGGLITQPLEISADAEEGVSALYLSGIIDPIADNVGLLQVGQALSFNDTDIIASFVHDVNGYAQVVMQNKSSGNTASADFIVNNDSPLGTSIYGDFGINSSTFVGTGGPFDIANGTYLYAAGGQLAVGTKQNHELKIATNDITRITVDNTGIVDFAPTAPVHIFSTLDSTAHDIGALIVEGGVGVGKNLVVDRRMYIGPDAVTTVLTNPTVVIKESGSTFIQAAILNVNSTGSADWVAYGDTSTESDGFCDFGFTGSGFNDPEFTITSRGDGYLFSSGYNDGTSTGNLVFATSDTGTTNDIVFGTGGYLAANERMRYVNSLGQLFIKTGTTSTSTTTGALRVTGGVGVSGNIYAGALYDSGNRVLTSATPINYVGDYKRSAQPADHGTWLLMDPTANRLVSRTTYPQLFALLGTTYGAGDGTTFGIPSQTDIPTFNFICFVTA